MAPSPPLFQELNSTSNPRIRALRELIQRPRTRRERELFVVEGYRELTRAIEGGLALQSLFYRADLQSSEEIIARLEESYSKPRSWRPTPERPPVHHLCSPESFARLAYRSDVPNIIGIFHTPHLDLSQLSPVTLQSAPLYLVIEGVEKPGNLGAILRSAGGLQVDAVFLCDDCAELYHPNTIRNSLGGLFGLSVVRCESAEASAWLQAHGVQRFVTSLEGSVMPHEVDLCAPSAIVLGSEASGVSAVWFSAAEARLRIPMGGLVDSLNVSSAAAIFLYEAQRQRGWHMPASCS